MSNTRFQGGQKIKCIDASGKGEGYLILGKTYTVNKHGSSIEIVYLKEHPATSFFSRRFKSLKLKLG